MRSHLINRRVLVTASALTLALAAAPIALAGTATAATPAATAALDSSGHFALYTAAPGQVNEVAVVASKAEGSADITYVIDDVVPVDAGDGCTYPDTADRTKVTCTVTTLETQDPYATLKLGLGDGDDVVRYDNATGQTYNFASIDLGDGVDELTDSGDVDGNSVRGGTGDDTISVGAAAVVLGDDGADTVRATGGGAVVQGGIGNDTIDADGDGSSVSGGPGNDVIHGGADDQNLSGDDGNDRIHGGTGNDWLYGGKGDDILYGNSGDDTLYGNSGNDALYGGPGRDTLSGGPGTNVVHQD
ncbi:calcium-binding protein [Streptomyces kunmingensis]|uniref:Calcium-binding protein n=1 Tax=Streptomyces kunmingensis TaxID=68225 RepID=A0ABU6C6W9_9ACTN|nr:calcium-binding protein [Streptomyces kunmingensis]MEB3960090.1 calcium-binding protein [Streptomyces kunmingensis]